jgi:hypothetical protein
MSTAALQYQPAATVSVPAAWWQRRDPYVLTTFSAVHVLLVGVAMRGIDAPASFAGAPEACLGFLLAQCFLLATWGALGGLGTVPRWCIIAVVYSGGVVSLSRTPSALANENYWPEVLVMGLIAATIVSGFAALLLPLRGLAGWRIDFTAEHYRDVRCRRGQFGFMDYAGLSCAAAVPLTAARLASDTAELGPGDWPWIVAVLGLVAVTASVSAYCLLAWRWVAAGVLAAATWFLVVTWAHSWLGGKCSEIVLYGSAPQFAGLHLGLAAFHAAVVGTVILTFGLLRLFGLKLLVVPLVQPGDRVKRL